MIVFPAQRLVLYTPPRCASISLHMTLPRYGGTLVYGPSGDGTVEELDQHTTWVDPAHADWKRVVVVRDEKDRLVSMYHLWLAKGFGPASFDEFVRLVNDGEPKEWLFRWTIEEWSRPLRPYTTIRYENLETDLSALLGTPVEMAFHEHASQREETHKYYGNSETTRLAKQWATGCRQVTNRSAMARRFPKFGVGLELGVFNGDFAKTLLAQCKPQVLYLLDHWLLSIKWGREQELVLGDEAHRRIRAMFANDILSGRIRVLHGPSCEWMPRLPNNHLDFAYIDADHSYEGVKTDLELCWSKVKPGGWIAGHDYCPLFPGVEQAVTEFCEKYGQRIGMMTNESGMAVDGQPGPIAFNSFAICKVI